MELAKTIEMNTLFDFYGPLLTTKQQDYLELYYQQDYSLGEIAHERNVSRQAVYDNIKRSEKLLKNYEATLHLVADFDQLDRQLKRLKDYAEECYKTDQTLHKYIDDISMER